MSVTQSIHTPASDNNVDNSNLFLIDGNDVQDNNDDDASRSEASNDSDDVNGNSNLVGSGTKRQVGGAAVAGGITGLVLGGPVLALVGAGGAAAVATSSRGKPGDFVRKSGDVMASAGDRLKEYDNKHRVVEKTSGSIRKGCEWVSKTDVGRKGGVAMASAGDRIRKYDEKHHVVQKTSTSIAKGCKWVSKKLHNKSETNINVQTAA